MRFASVRITTLEHLHRQNIIPP
ncbi:MAG: hypothetical protein ACD_65C00332G0001, partial [uncultured bacterium]